VAAFREGKLAVAHRNQHQAAAVCCDGGRLQPRAADAGGGVTDPGWGETKTAAVESLHSQVPTTDPRPEPPRRVKGREKFWVEGGGEAMLQVHTAYLSEGGRAERYWA
jgi:hypothetical protein